MDDLDAVSITLFCVALASTATVFVYGLTRTTRYEIQRTQMRRMRKRLNQMFPGEKN